MGHNGIAREVFQCALDLHREIGSGLLESVYETVLADELARKGLSIERQKSIPIRLRERTFEEGFRADLVVDRLVLVEIKSVASLLPVHRKQVLTYLKLADLRLGLLVNFGAGTLKGNFERLVNRLDEQEPI